MQSYKSANNKILLSIIIANYNTKEILKLCLNNLIKIPLNIEIIVVDNASTDGSAQMVSKEFKNVVLYKSTNKGISAAYNLGFKKSRGDFILYLGSDAFPTKESLSENIRFLQQNKKVGAVTSALYLENGKLDLDAHRGIPTPWVALTHFLYLDRVFSKSKIFSGYFLGYKDMQVPHAVGLCISHYLLVKREVILKLNGWDEDFFVFGEDVDFCYRLQQIGFFIYYLPNCKVKHLKGVSVGTRKHSTNVSTASITTKKRMRKLSTNAMRMFYKKHFMHKYPFYVTYPVFAATYIMEFLRGIKK
ncbi:glycosyltransferase family 2 protein [bacterium]|nr:glycosyltransferase family 2 protein [bacterium]